MTIDIPTRAPEQQAPPEGRRPRRGLGGGPQITFGRTSRTAGKAPLVVGGQPRANLLPPEIILKRKQLKTRRALRAGVLLVAVVTAAACVGTFGIASVAQLQFQAAQSEQQRLVLEQAQYQEVRDVQTTIQTIGAGQQVGASTEINWRSYLTALQGTLPEGVLLETVSIESGTPMQAYAQSDLPLQGSRVAALTFTATSSTLPTIPDWLRSMAKLPGFVDATPGSVKQEDGVYTAQVLMHINTDAFSLRFDPAHMAEVAAQQAEQAAHADAQLKSMVAPVETTDEAADGAADDGTTDGEGN
jgi:Tfp pilus assembly protein PilN